MTIKKNYTTTSVLYFCTITCCNWIPLIKITNLYSHVYKWFDLLKEKNIDIVSYVIMPNHFHFILYLPENMKDVNKIIANGKRFLAYEIIKKLKDKGLTNILFQLDNEVNKSDRKRGKLHQVFERSFDIKALTSEKFISQKIEYIHHNPVSKKWNLVEDYIKFQHSSAGFYENDVEYKGYPVKHVSGEFD